MSSEYPEPWPGFSLVSLDVDEAGGGTLVESIALIISSQAVIVKGVWRLSTDYLEGIIIEPSGSRGEASKCPLFLKA